jgi:AcrR family transcriptional regulator
VRKGELARKTILRRAVQLGSKVGLSGLTIGRLAADLRRSKSGVFAHFQSKEALQAATIRFAADSFLETVIRPALKSPRGEERVREIFSQWLDWPKHDPLQGGCFFVAAASELDDRPGPLRDLLVELQSGWLDVLAGTVRMAVEKGDFRPGVDAEQFAHDTYGVMLAFHHASRLLGDRKAEERAKASFEALLRAARNPGLSP